jgi:hypothetical protein
MFFDSIFATSAGRGEALDRCNCLGSTLTRSKRPVLWRPQSAITIIATLASLAGMSPGVSASQGLSSSSNACVAAWASVSTPRDARELRDVEVLSSSNVWAVGTTGGDYSARPAIWHWDGIAWEAVTQPAVGAGGQLSGIAAASPTDIWAVGDFDSKILIEHFDGTAWSEVPIPDAYGNLQDVAVAAPNDVWAVGIASRGSFVVHWNGLVWTIVPVTDPPSSISAGLISVLALSSNDVWAAGYWMDATVGHSLTQHWDGTAWTVVSTPESRMKNDALYGLAASSSSDIWAVGFAGSRGLVLHWEGNKWTRVSVPNPGVQSNWLRDVAVSAPHDVWAVGSYTDDTDHTMVLHWDGRSWRLTSSTTEWYGAAFLEAVDVLTPSEVWAVGSIGNQPQPAYILAQRVCPTAVGDGGFSPLVAAVPQGENAVWTFPETNASAHRVVDGTGMGLFSSRLKAPGGSYMTSFNAAGTYLILDPTTSLTGKIQVPLEVVPDPSSKYRFMVTWASVAAPAGFVYDVQVKVPGASGFSDWQVGQTAPSATFSAHDGLGTYRLRALLRQLDTGAESAWSPIAKILVQ